MQSRGSTLAPGILFDSDMGQNIDAVLALSMLYGLGRGRVIGVGVSSSTLEAAAFCDALARFHGAGGQLPIGLAEDGPKLDEAAMIREPLAMRNAEGEPLFRTNVRSVIDTADPPVLFRNALLTQQDGQGIVVLAGPATNLAHTLALPGAREIVSAKVQLLVLAAGAFDGATADPRIRADIASARKIITDWPSPIVAVGMEAARTVPFPAQGVESETTTAANHPALAGYRAYREKQSTEASGVPAPAALAALYAANSKADYWKLSSPGRIEVGNDGVTSFKESSSGTHRHVMIDSAEKQKITEALLALFKRPRAGNPVAPPAVLPK